MFISNDISMSRRIFITGGAHGIGRSIVEAFLQAGDQVAYCDLYDGNIAGARYLNVDVTDKNALQKCLETLTADWGDIDVIVNNVGIGGFKSITEVSIEEFEQVINTNLRSAFITSRFMARLRQNNGNKEYGRIVNLCSSRHLMSEVGTEAYSASKGGIYSLTHALAMSLAPMHITVNAIAPGWIHVDENEVLRPIDHEFHPSGRVGKPEDIARMVLFLCEPQNDFINGQTITIDGGVTKKMIYPE